MRKIILVFFVFIILFGTTKTYAQCDCANAGESESDEIKHSDAAFIGEVIKVIEIEIIKNSEYKSFDVTFNIKKSLKDDLIKTITIRNITSDDSDFEEKETYLVFAIKHNDNLLAWIGCCTSTRKIAETTNFNSQVLKCV